MDRLSVRPRIPRAPFAGVESLEGRRMLHGAPHDPAMLDEHLAMLALVPDEAVTDTAVRSGAWSDPSTWGGAHVPSPGANALVPAGLTVTVDRVDPTPLRTVRVDGTLTFATAVDTQLSVDTLVVTPEGTLVIGTASDPVRADVTARVLFPDRGPIDTEWDPRLLSRGLVAHGATSVYGAPKTGFAALAGPAARGARTIALAEPPEGWRQGDRLVLAGTSASANQDEQLTVVSVEGRFVRVNKPLAYTHAAPQPDLPLYVTDLTRNVVFASENRQPGAANVALLGHGMKMHSPAVDVNNAAFDHLGRTDKAARINDPRLDDDNRLIPGTGANPRGRYSVHFHRTGVDEAGEGPARVRGSVVDGGAGWGFVNHSSDVTFEDDVSYDVAGAGFVSEAGDEIGAFRHNFALRSAGSGEGVESRLDVQDFGHGGHGFWFQGPGVEVEGNVAAGQRGPAFIYFTRGLRQAGIGTTRFPSANLVDPSIAGGEASVDVGDVPVRLFRNNYAFASGDGFETWFHLLDAKHEQRSVIDGMTTWGVRDGRGVFIPYTRRLTLRNVRALGNPRSPAGIGVAGNDATGGIDVYDARVEGFELGIAAPRRGDNVVRGGLLNNVHNVHVTDAVEPGRTLDVTAVRFGYLAPAALRGRRQYDLYVKPAALAPESQDLPRVFGDDAIRINGREAYRPEQAAGFVPYPAGAATTPGYVPPELIGRTNRQLWALYGLAVGGAVAPEDAGGAGTPGRPRSNAMLARPAAHLPALILQGRKYTNRLGGYQLVYSGEREAEVHDPLRADLRQGWNLLTRPVDGRRRTFFVFGDVTPPRFVSTRPLVINPLALPGGFTVRALVADDSIGDTVVTRTFTDLPNRPLRARPDGSRYIALDVHTADLAGNPVNFELELTVDPAAPM